MQIPQEIKDDLDAPAATISFVVEQLRSDDLTVENLATLVKVLQSATNTVDNLRRCAVLMQVPCPLYMK